MLTSINCDLESKTSQFALLYLLTQLTDFLEYQFTEQRMRKNHIKSYTNGKYNFGSENYMPSNRGGINFSMQILKILSPKGKSKSI